MCPHPFRRQKKKKKEDGIKQERLEFNAKAELGQREKVGGRRLLNRYPTSLLNILFFDFGIPAKIRGVFTFVQCFQISRMLVELLDP